MGSGAVDFCHAVDITAGTFDMEHEQICSGRE